MPQFRSRGSGRSRQSYPIHQGMKAPRGRPTQTLSHAKVDPTYDFYSDPSHGWLRVPESQVEKLGIQNDISEFSYKKGGYVYLEEDADASLFMNKAKEVGIEVKTREHNADSRSQIRTYPSYYAPNSPKARFGGDRNKAWAAAVAEQKAAKGQTTTADWTEQDYQEAVKRFERLWPEG